MSKFINLVNMTFGRLKVIEYKGSSKWLCECSCTEHNQVIVYGYNLKNGNTNSCGCFQKERTASVTSNIKKPWEPIEIDDYTYGIPLTKGYVALIDKEDYDKVKNYGWHVTYNKHTNSFYAQTEINKKGIKMHRLILNATEGLNIDHKDHNTLNNRKSNIRICTTSQNTINSKRRSDNNTGFKGVSFRKGKYIARIMVDQKPIHIGSFKTALEAHEAYKEAAKKLHGEFYCE